MTLICIQLSIEIPHQPDYIADKVFLLPFDLAIDLDSFQTFYKQLGWPKNKLKNFAEEATRDNGELGWLADTGLGWIFVTAFNKVEALSKP